MSHLPGNPFAERIESLADEHAEVAVALAIAYEQRTANLIAMQALGITDLTDWIPEHADAWIERADAIEKRLGETK